jgi:branched-chain amino acid aminotransferase
MSDFVVLNGRKIPAAEALLPITNRAFRYGDSLFESMRMLRGNMPFRAQHMSRLTSGLRVLDFQLEPEQLQTDLEQAINLLTDRQGNYRIRIQVWREGEGLYRPIGNDIGYLVEATPMKEGAYEYHTPITIATEYGHYPHIGALHGLKTGSALPYVAAASRAQHEGFDDRMLYNPDKSVAEATRGNIFFMLGSDVMLTPPRNRCGLMGIMRDFVIQTAEHSGIEVRMHEPVHLESTLPFISEAFLTNSVSGVIPISRIGWKNLAQHPVSKLFVDAINGFVDAKHT